MQVRSRVVEQCKRAELRSIQAGEPQRWSVRRLALAAGVNPTTVQGAIHRIDSCSVGTLAKLATALGCELADLVALVPDDDQGQGPA